MKIQAKGLGRLLSRNILSTGAVLALMGVAAFAAAPTGGYAPGATLDPDCSPGDTDCTVVFSEEPNKFVDGTTATDAVFTGGNVGIGTEDPNRMLTIEGGPTATIKSKVYDNTSLWKSSGFAGSRSRGGVVGSDVHPLLGDRITYFFGQNDTGGVSSWAGMQVFASENHTDTGKGMALHFNTTNNGNTDNSVKMAIDNAGNVGIGTTAPSAKLDVSGNIASNGETVISNSSNTTYLRSKGGTTNEGAGINLHNEDHTTYPMSSHFLSDISYFNGNVGIGTTAPSAKLEIREDGTSPGIKINYATGNLFATIEGPTNRDLRFDLNDNDVNDKFHFRAKNATSGTSDLMVIKTDGNVGIGTITPSSKLHVVGTITETSDERLKKNIAPVGNALEKISKLIGVSFDWRDTEKMDDRTHLGLIAQNVETVFPELVYTEEDDLGTKSVNYDGMIGPMIEAIKELKAENQKLRKRLEDAGL